MKKSHKAEKHKFKPKKLTGVEAQAAAKAKIARAPQMPNLDMSMRGGTSI